MPGYKSNISQTFDIQSKLFVYKTTLKYIQEKKEDIIKEKKNKQ